jgi:hypothetical protein
MPLQIREATLSDASTIAHIHVDSWRTSYGSLTPDELHADSMKGWEAV